MRCIVVATLTVSGCVKTSSEPEHLGEDCNVTAVVEEASSVVPDVRDCGDVETDDDLEAWTTAHACAVDALHQGVPMQLFYQVQGIDSLSFEALLRPAQGGDVRFYYDTWDDEGASVRSYTCPTVVARPDCIVEVGQICLMCSEGSTEVEECLE
jgi:hypothetical protein